MDNDLFSCYQKELSYLRSLMGEYADSHPKIASRLRLTQRGSEDPHIKQLIESVAFSNAKLCHQLDDELPEISEPLLSMIAPHFIAPVPALSIAQFHPGKPLQNKKLIAKNTLLQLSPNENDALPCRFTTCYPVELWPIAISAAQLTSQPLQAPGLTDKTATKFGIRKETIKASLRMSLRVNNAAFIWSELAPDNLRFYLAAEAPANYRLYDLLLRHTALIALAESANDPEPIYLSAAHLKAIGFADDEGLLPYSPRVKAGYRLLMDYAILPEKFLFIELTNLASTIKKKFTRLNQLIEIFIYLDADEPELQKSLDATHFALGCTPIINLFPAKMPGFSLAPHQNMQQLALESHLPHSAYEIYAIQKVIAAEQGQTEVELNSLFSMQHVANAALTAYYSARRVPAWQAGHYEEYGTEILLHFSDKNHQPIDLSEKNISVDVLCSNRDLLRQFSFDKVTAQLDLADAKDETIANINCLKTFTPVRRPFLNKDANWLAISHLMLNHHLLTDDTAGIQAFRALLKIYDFDQSRAFQSQLDGLLKISAKFSVERNPQPNDAAPLIQCVKIHMHIDPDLFQQASWVLLGGVLERFLPLFCNQQSGTQLTINAQNAQQAWPVRIGEQMLF
jgi:type VI secretion system protein ImpG